MKYQNFSLEGLHKAIRTVIQLKITLYMNELGGVSFHKQNNVLTINPKGNEIEILDEKGKEIFIEIVQQYNRLAISDIPQNNRNKGHKSVGNRGETD
jgi:hypothetical protein